MTPAPDPLDWIELSLREPPSRKWAIKGWLGFGHVTLLVGQGGIGKTLIAQQAASALALGRKFIDDIPDAQKVLMWACEDDHDELWRRQVAIARWLDVQIDAFAENLVIVPRHGLENSLLVNIYGENRFTTLLTHLKEEAERTAAQVIILDNVGQLYGGSENDRHSVTMFLNGLSGILPGRAILLLGHPSRSMGSEFSGSSAWENVARTRLYLSDKLPTEQADDEADPNSASRYLSRRKSNYRDNRDWRKFDYKDGVLLPEYAASQGGGGIIETIRERNAEKAVVEGLQQLQKIQLWPCETPNSPRFLPRMLQEHKLSNGQSKSDLAGAMRRLMVDGTLVISEVGTYGNRNPMRGLKLAQSGAQSDAKS